MTDSRLRVLVVDDSSVFRRVVIRCIESLPCSKVVGVAGNGREALEKLENLEVDLVLLDIKMPDMDRIQTLERLKERGNRARVIVLSAHSPRTVDNTVAALLLGAEDFLVKPSHSKYREHELREKLAPHLTRPTVTSSIFPAVAAKASISSARNFQALVVAASTGGPKVLEQVFKALPDVHQPIFIAQHMPEDFTRALASQLDACGVNRVKEAEHGERVQPSTTYLAPGNHHLRICRQENHLVVTLDQAPRVKHCRPSADVLFRSAARCYGRSCLGLVLTGMGQDGLEGARSVVDAGGEVFAQGQEGCVVWGMPKAVLEAGIARQVELAGLPDLLSRLLRPTSNAEGG